MRGINLIGLAALTLLAFALRVYNLGQPSLWYDELLELDVAQSSLSQIWLQLERHAAMPLDYYILYGWIKLGRQEMWVRFPALVFGTLAVPVIYGLASRLFNRKVGYLAAILLAGSSFAIRYSQEVRPYALLLLLVMVSYVGLWQVYRTGKGSYWLVALLGLIGAALTHYFTLFMLLPMGLFVSWQQLAHFNQKKFWQHTVYFGLSVFILLAVFTLAGRLRHLYNVGTRFSTVVSQPETLTLPAAEKPNRGSGPPVDLNFFVTNVLMPLATADQLLLLCYSALFLAGPLSLIRRKPYHSGSGIINNPLTGHRSPVTGRYFYHRSNTSVVKAKLRPPIFSASSQSSNDQAMLLLLDWLFLPVILIYLFLLQRGTFFATRYILYTLPAYLILVAYGINKLITYLLGRQVRSGWPGNPRSSRNLLFSSLLLLALIPLIFAEFGELLAYYRAEVREDWRAVGQLLQANARPDDVVIAVKAEPAINWYYPPAHVPFGTFGSSEPIWQALREHQRRWFVLSSYSYKRDKGLRDWLGEQGAVIIAIDRRVVVYYHQEGLPAKALLAHVRDFALPPKALTYVTLAEQFKRQGDLETSQAFYQKAIELADPASRKIIEAQLQAKITASSVVAEPLQ